MPRVLLDKWVGKDETMVHTSEEGITITILNKSISNKRVRVQLQFKRGRKRKGEAMANPKGPENIV
jgi:hypothetical protein